MALKDWKKERNLNNKVDTYRNKDDYIQIWRYSKDEWRISDNSGLLNFEKTKSKAMTFAKNYMRAH